jgi:lipopolysaccharide assembly outer membrane protein LptD (OstA)
MQHDPVFYADFTINYRINHKRSSSQISLQVKNVLASSIVENFNYNFKTNSVQLDTSQPVLPVISYKIEF